VGIGSTGLFVYAVAMELQCNLDGVLDALGLFLTLCIVKAV
jgi:hypothetical protein